MTWIALNPSSIAPDPWPDAWAEFEARVFQLLNDERAACALLTSTALAPLVLEPRLGVAARRHSWDMATTGRFDHTGTDGLRAMERIAAAGYGIPAWQGENISAGHTTPEAVVSGWMGSPGHRANILLGSFREAGVGYAFSSSSPAGHYWTLVLAAR